MRIRKGDMVVVISGSEKGKVGQVLRVFPKTNRVIVEKVRLIKRHTKPGRQGQQQGGIVEKEAPISLSSVSLIDPRTQEPTRVRIRRLPSGGRERVAAKSGESLEKP
jgi:large subunit ribosomal protein L24